MLIFSSRQLKWFLTLEQLCVKDLFLKVKPQPESANGAWGSGSGLGNGAFGGKEAGWWRAGQRACKTSLGLMRSRSVSRRLMLTAAARWRVWVRSIYPGQEGSWVQRERERDESGWSRLWLQMGGLYSTYDSCANRMCSCGGCSCHPTAFAVYSHIHKGL